MTALNFPSNPASQTPANTFSPTSTPSSTSNGITYVYDGTKWTASSSGGGGSQDLQSVTDKGDTTTNGATFGGQVTASGGIEFGDGTTQTTAASGGGSGDLQSVTDAGNTTTDGATFGGAIQTGGDARVGAAMGIQLDPTGTVSATTNSSTGSLWEGYTTGGSSSTSSITAGGSAKFAGGAFKIESDGVISTNVNTNAKIKLDSTDNFTTPKILLDSVAGSATFSGPVSVGGTAAANTMSEYEEGLWVPTLGGNSTSDIQWGRYVKVGTFVQCWGGLRPTSIGTGTNKSIQGLPFATATGSGATDQGGGSIVWSDGAATDFVSAVISVANASTQAQINVITSATKVLQNSIAFWINGYRANFYFCYFTEN